MAMNKIIEPSEVQDPKQPDTDKLRRPVRLVYDMSLGDSPCYGGKTIIIRDTCDEPAAFRSPFIIDKPE